MSAQNSAHNFIAFTGATSAVALDLYRPHRTFTFVKVPTGPFSVLVVNFEGSLDGVTWFQLGTDNTLVTSTTFAVDKPCRFIRATVATFTGGTNVSVSALAVE